MIGRSPPPTHPTTRCHRHSTLKAGTGAHTAKGAGWGACPAHPQTQHTPTPIHLNPLLPAFRAGKAGNLPPPPPPPQPALVHPNHAYHAPQPSMMPQPHPVPCFLAIRLKKKRRKAWRKDPRRAQGKKEECLLPPPPPPTRSHECLTARPQKFLACFSFWSLFLLASKQSLYFSPSPSSPLTTASSSSSSSAASHGFFMGIEAEEGEGRLINPPSTSRESLFSTCDD